MSTHFLKARMSVVIAQSCKKIIYSLLNRHLQQNTNVWEKQISQMNVILNECNSDKKIKVKVTLI